MSPYFMTPVHEYMSKALIAVRLRLPPYPYRDADILGVLGRDVELRFRGADAERPGLCIEDCKRVAGRWLAAGGPHSSSSSNARSPCGSATPVVWSVVNG